MHQESKLKLNYKALSCSKPRTDITFWISFIANKNTTEEITCKLWADFSVFLLKNWFISGVLFGNYTCGGAM